MFRGANYWVADVVMLSISVALVGMIAKDAFAGCFREALNIGASGVRALAQGQLSHRAQVAPEGSDAAGPTGVEAAAAEAGENQNSAALAAELQLLTARLAENEARFSAKLAQNEARFSAKLAENNASLAEKDALVASLSEKLGIEDMNVGVGASRDTAPIPTPGGGGGGTETLHRAHVHNDAPAMSTMAANVKGEIVVTSNERLALSAAMPGQGHLMTAENTSGRVIRRDMTESGRLFTNTDFL